MTATLFPGLYYLWQWEMCLAAGGIKPEDVHTNASGVGHNIGNAILCHGDRLVLAKRTAVWDGLHVRYYRAQVGGGWMLSIDLLQAAAVPLGAAQVFQSNRRRYDARELRVGCRCRHGRRAGEQ